MSQKSVSVTVNVGSGITVSPTTPVQVQKNQDTVQWKGTSAQEFNIVFKSNGAPAVTCGLQGNKWVCESGVFENNTGSAKKLKYDITSSGTPMLDPEVEVQP